MSNLKSNFCNNLFNSSHPGEFDDFMAISSVVLKPMKRKVIEKTKIIHQMFYNNKEKKNEDFYTFNFFCTD